MSSTAMETTGHGGDVPDGGGEGSMPWFFGVFFAVFCGTWVLVTWLFGWRGMPRALIGLPVAMAVAMLCLAGLLWLFPSLRE